MRKNISKLASVTLAALIAISALMVLAPSGKANPTSLNVISTDGLYPATKDSNFTTVLTTVGYEFIVNITVYDITDLQNWQIKLTWDGSLLSFVDISLPTDHVFSASGKSMVTPPVDSGSNYVLWGCTYTNGDHGTLGYWSFNGTGQLCQVKLQIIQAVGEMPPTHVSCALILADIPDNTFLLDGYGHDIDFTGVNGAYDYKYVEPPYKPTLYIKPSVCKPAKKGDLVPLEIWVRDVHAGWSIIGFQFSLMWNTTFVEPALGPHGLGLDYYNNGTFLEGFQYYTDGVMYVESINMHDRTLPYSPMPDGWNFSMFGCILLPDSPPQPPYHPIFPHTSPGDGLLMTVYFKAIYDTVSPVEDWTWIRFIPWTLPVPYPPYSVPQDTYALNQYTHEIAVGMEDCHYRAPQRVLGLAIDLYTQYSAPYGGQGAHQPSDMFGPQDLVDLFAYVSYNEYPVQQKLVGFHIIHNGYDIYREAATDENGIAHVIFRLPWPCVDPVGEIFGKWYVIATVEVAGEIKNDTLAFWVWWKVFVMSVEPKKTSYVQRKSGGDDLTFTVLYGTYSMQELPVTLTVTVYDELNFFIGSDYMTTTVGWGEYKYYNYMICETPPLKTYPAWDVDIPLPTNAVVGKGTVFGDAYTAFPWLGGVPYCPEVTNTIDFYIVKPP